MLSGLDLCTKTEVCCAAALGAQQLKTKPCRPPSLSPKWDEVLMLCWDGSAPLQLEVCAAPRATRHTPAHAHTRVRAHSRMCTDVLHLQVCAARGAHT